MQMVLAAVVVWTDNEMPTTTTAEKNRNNVVFEPLKGFSVQSTNHRKIFSEKRAAADRFHLPSIRSWTDFHFTRSPHCSMSTRMCAPQLCMHYVLRATMCKIQTTAWAWLAHNVFVPNNSSMDDCECMKTWRDEDMKTWRHAECK